MTARLLPLALVFAVAVQAGGAPPAATETAAERMDRFARHRAVVEDMVSRGVELANTANDLDRAEACHRTAADLARGLRAAAAADDPARVAELGDYLRVVLVDALTPSLEAARTRTPVGSPDRPKYEALADAAAKTAAVELPSTGKVGDSARVTAVRANLRTAAAGLPR